MLIFMKWYLSILILLLSIKGWADTSTISQFPKPLLVNEQIEQVSLSAFCGVFMEENGVLTVQQVHQNHKSEFQPIIKKFYH